MFKEKRTCLRKDVSIDTRITVNGRSCEDKIKNLSVDGAFIDTKNRFFNGEKILIIYDSPVFGKEKRSATIKRITSHGIAVEFKFPNQNKNF